MSPAVEGVSATPTPLAKVASDNWSSSLRPWAPFHHSADRPIPACQEEQSAQESCQEMGIAAQALLAVAMTAVQLPFEQYVAHR